MKLNFQDAVRLALGLALGAIVLAWGVAHCQEPANASFHCTLPTQSAAPYGAYPAGVRGVWCYYRPDREIVWRPAFGVSFRTDRDGAVTVHSDGTSIDVDTFSGRSFNLPRKH